MLILNTNLERNFQQIKQLFEKITKFINLFFEIFI